MMRSLVFEFCMTRRLWTVFVAGWLVGCERDTPAPDTATPGRPSPAVNAGDDRSSEFLAIKEGASAELLTRGSQEGGAIDNAATSPSDDDAVNASDSTISDGLLLSEAVNRLRAHGVSLTEAALAVKWDDGLPRRLYIASHTARAEDALFVATRDSSRGEILDSMYWHVNWLSEHQQGLSKRANVHRYIQELDAGSLSLPFGEAQGSDD